MRLRLKTSSLALAAGGALALAPSAFAQEADRPDTSRDVIVVTGSATPVDYEKLGQTITVIDGELIEDQGYSYVPDVLRQVPGLAVSQPGAPGALTQVRTRGAEANHTLVLLDGIDITSPNEGEMDFSTLLTGDLQRIEVLRGPQSGLYGSNALAGVVNLITRRDIDGHYVGVSAEGGSFNTFQLQGNAGVGNGEDYASVGFHALTSEGYDVSPDQTANGIPAVGVGATPGDKEGNKLAAVYLRGGKTISDIFRIDGVARYLSKHSELDGQAYNFPIAGKSYDDASATDHKQFVIGASGTLSLMDGKWETVGSASWLDEQRRNRVSDFPFLFGPPVPSPAALLQYPVFTSGADSTRTKVMLQSTYAFGAPGFVSFLTGFAEHKEETYADPFSGRDEERNLTGIGVQYRAEVADQLYVSAVARHDDSDDFEDADTYSLGVSWVVPNTGTRPHASIGTGVTNPTFFEQFGFNPGSFVGNPNLVPEEARGWDVGVEQTLFGGMAAIDLTYFESTLKNEIYTSFGPAPSYLSTPANRTTRSDRSGWEASFRINPADDIDIVGSYTSLDATEPAGIEIRRPENQAAIDAGWRINGGPVRLNLGVTYNGEQVDTDFGSFVATRMDPYTLVRLGASWQVNDQIEVYGRFENLTDEDYQEVIGFDAAPQAVYVGIRFREATTK